MTEESWQDNASCADLTNKDIFFEDDPVSIKKAKAVCGACPVRRQCLKDSKQRLDVFSVSGGYTAAERGFPDQSSLARANLPYGDKKKPIDGAPQHGTKAGYLKHEQLNETICDYCLLNETLRTLHRSVDKKWSKEDY